MVLLHRTKQSRHVKALTVLCLLVVFCASVLLFTDVIVFVPRSGSRVRQGEVPLAIAIVSDSNFASRFRTQARSIECYAISQGYEYFLLDPAQVAPSCQTNHEDFFFRKHCTIAQWLLTRPPRSVVVVVDGDVIAGTADRSLDSWLKYEFDLAFYERSWNFEVMSGNYIARNTRFTRLFLHHWANYEYIRPTGFSSADNGALHLVLLHALGIRGRHRCQDLYRRLEAEVTDLNPYYEYVACTKQLLGPPRVHHAYGSAHMRRNGASSQNPVGTIVIFPRLFGFAVDSRIHTFTEFRNLHPFHHGLKSENWKSEYFDEADQANSTGCRPFTKRGAITEEEMGKRLQNSDNHAAQSTGDPFSVVPRWTHADPTCYRKLWCAPLRNGTTIWPSGFIAKNGTIAPFEYSDPGFDWYNEFASALSS